VDNDTITIRHSIPSHPRTPPNGTEPPSDGRSLTAGQGYLLRSGSAFAHPKQSNDSDVHCVLAAVNLSIHRDHDKALHHQDRALALNPNDNLIVVQQGEVPIDIIRDEPVELRCQSEQYPDAKFLVYWPQGQDRRRPTAI
jgi:hypothetical protein